MAFIVLLFKAYLVGSGHHSNSVVNSQKLQVKSNMGLSIGISCCNLAFVVMHFKDLTGVWWTQPSLQHSTLRWRHNGCDGVSNHRRLDCLFKRLFRRKSTKTSKLRVTGLCEGNPPVTGWFPSQRASNGENVSIWWRDHEMNNIEYQCSEKCI